MEKGRIYREGNKIFQDCSDITTFILVYDLTGKYLGQYQSNMLDDAGGDIFLPASAQFTLPPLSAAKVEAILQADEARI